VRSNTTQLNKMQYKTTIKSSAISNEADLNKKSDASKINAARMMMHIVRSTAFFMSRNIPADKSEI